jgi:hypothetical protein
MLVYVCIELGDDKEVNKSKIKTICDSVFDAGHIPITPYLMYLDYVTKKDEIISLCNELIRACDELWYYLPENGKFSSQMLAEIAHAMNLGIKIRQKDFYS